ncbi:hypothetical protein MOQ_008384 [Trypanosoma cruzi marinkellei]|uniref:LisH domain-containing protein n=1 Tax=Trypanosoma cruzi marinkellei TaxID=85056 RepID=K2LYW1_TRYCR|nr:hypothetical protein MOQ_008384 [Trypanosoma cruzi marinkellei]
MEENPVEEDVNEINTTLLELQDAFATALRNAGVLGKLRAQLRAAAISVIRGDPYLRTAAVGKTILPAALSPEGRVALLLIEEFARVHGLQQTLGVFEEESNLSLVGELERNTAQRLRGSLESSALEQLIAAAMAREAPQLQGKEPIMTSGSMLPASTPCVSDEREEEREQHTGNRQHQQPKKEVRTELETPRHPEIAAGLKEYEDSINYSIVSVTGLPGVDESNYDKIEKF